MALSKRIKRRMSGDVAEGAERVGEAERRVRETLALLDTRKEILSLQLTPRRSHAQQRSNRGYRGKSNPYR